MARGGRWWLWAPISALVVALLLPIGVFLVTALLTGHHLQAVRSGSMEPRYPVGSLLVVGSVDPSNVRVGMPLSFRSDGHEVTHRVVEVLSPPSGLEFRTKGDANARPDPSTVGAAAVRGRVKWSVPLLGHAVVWLAWPRGFVLLVVVPAVVLVVTELRGMRVRRPIEVQA